MKKALFSLLCLALALPALAGTLAGVTLADKADAGGTPLVLNGMGLRTKFFIKIYVGGLYLPAKKANAAEVLASDGARQMVMHWLYGVGPEKVCEGWNEGLAANTPNASAQLKKDFETLCGFMTETANGDHIVLTYLPGQGTTIEVKGAVKGTIAGKEFSDALLSCWIGPKPGPGEDFKKGVLGG